MKVEITYCVRCNYLPRATGLAAALKEALGVEATLIRGSDGIFDVAVDGALVFSKDEAGRFPSHDEIIRSARARQTAAPSRGG